MGKATGLAATGRLLLITGEIVLPPSGGRALLGRVNHDALGEIFSSHFSVLELATKPVSGWRSAMAALRGHIDGVDESVIARTIGLIRGEGVDKVFLDGSNLGKLAAAIKRTCPKVEVTTFFHNCEARFFLGAFRQRPSVRACGVLLANYLAERSAVHFSDKRICLNERDSRLIQRLYGRAATHISPMAMRDEFHRVQMEPMSAVETPYALFVGGNFYANRQGIEWFVDYVAARSPLRTVVVGKGLEEFKERLERNGNVEVVGAVGDLAPWYVGATAVIAPIFDGSGMKTKVAEALMYGKRVIGTPEAFVGYEAVAPDAGKICNSPADFLAALQDVESEQPAVSPRLREIYLRRYSFDAAKTQLAAILAA